jgi:lipopolysaccharide export system protein LptA
MKSSEGKTGAVPPAGPVLWIAALSCCVCASSLVLKNANTNRNTMTNGELVSYLEGSVVFEYDEMTVRADKAKWWRSQKLVKLWSRVRVEKKRQLLSCDNMDFSGEKKELAARGRIRFDDRDELTTITGERGTYYLDSSFFVLSGKPEFLHCDTAAAETLFIKGRTMTYNDSTRIATVNDSVLITKGDLTCRCGRAFYSPDSSRVLLRTGPTITFKEHALIGDSIDLQFDGNVLKTAIVVGNSHGTYVDYTQGDTTTTNIWGDSTYMALSDSGRLDSVWVHGKVVSKYYEAETPELINEVTGKRMRMAFAAGEDSDDLRVWENVTSTYYITEKDGSGRNEASGDSLHVIFKGGKASTLSLSGGTRGIYFPEDR